MDDIHIEGTFSHFDATALEYVVQFWVEHFVADVFWQERKYSLPGLEKQPLFDTSGRAVTFVKFSQTLETDWLRLPVTKSVGFSLEQGIRILGFAYCGVAYALCSH